MTAKVTNFRLEVIYDVCVQVGVRSKRPGAVGKSDTGIYAGDGVTGPGALKPLGGLSQAPFSVGLDQDPYTDDYLQRDYEPASYLAPGQSLTYAIIGPQLGASAAAAPDSLQVVVRFSDARGQRWVAANGRTWREQSPTPPELNWIDNRHGQ